MQELGVLENADLVVKANPNSRFILMLRDGRAFVQPTDDSMICYHFCAFVLVYFCTCIGIMYCT